MGLSLVTAATIEPVSLAEAKDHLRVTEPEDDGQIARHIIAARRFAEGYIRGAIPEQTFDYTVDNCWPMVWDKHYCTYRIELPLHPVQSVTSVSYVDTNGATQTLSASLYTVHTKGPVPYVQKAYNATWPEVRMVPEAITVRFVCGYEQTDVPQDIKDAILLHVESLYDCDDKERCESCRNSLLDPYRVLRVS